MTSDRKKRLDAKIIISGLIISGLLFFSGMYMGYTFSREKLSYIESTMNKIATDVQNFQLEFLFLDVLGENATCPLLANTLSEINDESYKIGARLTSYGSENEIKDYGEYMDMKKKYSRLLVGYWLLANKLKYSCKLDSDTIVYFFSKDCAKCDDQGFILTYLKKKLEDKLLVFALDADLEEPSIQTIKKFYNITKYPALIINEKVQQGFMTKDELENVLAL